MRVLADTNLFIAYLLNPSEHHFITLLLEAVSEGKVTLLMPETLLSEISLTVQRKPHLLQRITASRLTQFLTILQSVCEEIPMIRESIPAVTRDPKDDYLLAYAFVGQAEYLITGDKDLLELPAIPQLVITTSAQFREILHSLS
ncbi:MAG: putative toxin-antitoxin system toxin component, PIN family [Anaerolinea sp.]|nr:putative toxin-antitoxin system toxin component, PIN family [Anaerolinea sp.]